MTTVPVPHARAMTDARSSARRVSHGPGRRSPSHVSAASRRLRTLGSPDLAILPLASSSRYGARSASPCVVCPSKSPSSSTSATSRAMSSRTPIRSSSVRANSRNSPTRYRVGVSSVRGIWGRLTQRGQSTSILTHLRHPSSHVTPATLTISIVTYRPDLALLDRTLRALAPSLAAAHEQGALRAANVVLIDNTGSRTSADAVIKLGQGMFEYSEVTMNYLHGHANIGYGAAHNLVMHGGNTHYHLVLNPDVELAIDALAVGLGYLEEHPEIGVLAPAVSGAHGEREFTCKRYPAVLDLAL